MRVSVLIIFLFTLGRLNAQIIDDSSIQGVQDGGYTFVEGMFVAYLSDTVSPGFIRDQFRVMKVNILDEQIEPILISIVNSPSEKRINELRKNENIAFVDKTLLQSEVEAFERQLEQMQISEEAKEVLRKRNPVTETYVIEFKFSVNKVELKKIMGEYRDIAYKIIRDTPRTVTLEAEPGNEPLLMDKVEALPFVASTAMIGTIKNR